MAKTELQATSVILSAAKDLLFTMRVRDHSRRKLQQSRALRRSSGHGFSRAVECQRRAALAAEASLPAHNKNLSSRSAARDLLQTPCAANRPFRQNRATSNIGQTERSEGSASYDEGPRSPAKKPDQAGPWSFAAARLQRPEAILSHEFRISTRMKSARPNDHRSLNV